MRIAKRYVIPIILLLFPTAQGFAASWVEQTLQGDGTAGPYRIGVAHLIEGTEMIAVSGTVMRPNEDYRFNGRDGTVTFTDTIPTGAAVAIRVQRVPLVLREEYRHRRIATHEASSGNTESLVESPGLSLSPPISRNDTPQSNGPGTSPLTVKGSKTFGVRLGSDRTLSLDQSLSLTVSGRVGRDVDVTALLSDRHLPIQPEGNTRTLSELDKVLLQVHSERLGVSLGDLDMTVNETTFGGYNRRLKGLQGEISLPGKDGRLTVVGGASEGRFTTKVLHPIEGSQGPYQLTSEDGGGDIVVIAGTERIWVNGVLMTRGETDDYTIDYGRGQVFFTGRRLVTAESRIIAEYEYTDQRFQRQVAALAGRSSLFDGKVTLGLTAIREADAPDRALAFDLSEDDRAVLRDVGDDEQSAWKSQDAGPFPAGSVFSWAGEGEGDYRYIGGGRYEYVGAGKGTYTPGIRLPLPERHQLTAFGITMMPSRRLTLNVEGALSDRDRNLFSTKDDDDNVGRAYTIRTSLTPDGEYQRGVSFSGSHRFVGARFRPLGRVDGVEERRRWGLGLIGGEGDQLEGLTGRDESSTEITAGYTFNTLSQVSVGVGQSRREDNGRSVFSTRREISTSWGRTGWPSTTYHLERIMTRIADTPERITRHRGAIEYAIAGVRPEIRVEAEQGDAPVEWGKGDIAVGEVFSDPVVEYLDIGGSVTPVGERRLMWASTYTLRRERRRTEWKNGRTEERRPVVSSTLPLFHSSTLQAREWEKVVTQSHRASFRADGGTVLTGEYARRDRRSGPNSATARVGADFSPFEGIVAGKARYEFSHLRASKRRKTFIDVGEGRGSYRWEDRDDDGRQDVEEYTWDPDGRYTLYVEEIGDYRPATEAMTDISLSLDPGLRSSRFSSFSSETSLNVRWRTERGGGFPFLDPLRFRVDSVTLEGRRSVEQVIDLFRGGRPYSFRLRYRQNDDLDRGDVDGANLQKAIERSIRGRYRTTRGIEAEVEYASALRKRSGRGVFDFDIHSRTLTSRLTHRPSFRRSSQTEIRFTVVGGFERDERPSPDTRVRWFSAGPEVTQSLSDRGRLRLRGEWVDVDVQPRRTPIVFQLARGRREGRTVEWTGSLDYRVKTRTTATFSYTGRRYPGLPVTHLGQAEVRAYF